VTVTPLTFESPLRVSREQLWAWMTDVDCLRREMMPILAMTHPRGVRSLADVPFTPGRRLYRSWLLLGGVLPFDRSDLTLEELVPGRRLVERSPLLSMRAWRHVREILDHPERPDAVVLRDTVAFVPRLPRAVAAWFVGALFRHRHAVLRRVHRFD
jgi:ligand-binding SRPBCC domain-containing protein